MSRKVKLVHIHTPSEHIGNASTLSAGNKYDLIENEHGHIEIKSKITNRLIVVPSGNIRAYEIETGEEVVTSKRGRK